MPRRFAVLLLVLGCGGKKEPPKQTPGTASGSAVVVAAIDAAAQPDAFVPTGPIELLHNYGGRLEVSSHVKNNAIKPEHLADKDFNTAWNSQTGQLAGAWIEVHISGATIHDLRLTVGHTGKGPKGEDYFTMNPQITKVSILEYDGKLVMTAGLDPNVRELQTITLPKPTRSPLRIKVEEVTMGTKTNWREVCVSEIEAWGMPAADAPHKPGKPMVYVQQSDLPKHARVEPGKPVDVVALCDALMKPMLKDFKARGGASLEDPGPDCDPSEDERKLDTAPWSSVFMWRIASNSAHGPMTCRLVASTELGDFFIGEERGCGPWDDEGLALVEAAAEDVIPGGSPELVVRFQSARDDLPIHMMVCRVAFDAVQCTKPYEIETRAWKVTPRFAKGVMHIDLVEGKPPAELTGAHALNFDH